MRRYLAMGSGSRLGRIKSVILCSIVSVLKTLIGSVGHNSCYSKTTDAGRLKDTALGFAPGDVCENYSAESG
jgi:hypothetical protein